MSSPPFKLAFALDAVASPGNYQAACCEEHAAEEEATTGRARLVQLNPHFHCSVIGTCMGTAELRKLAGRFMDVKGLTDLEVHHESVIMASQAAAARVLHKALDQRHAAVLARFAKARGSDALVALWEEALSQGEIPGAYWALLTHRDVTTDVRKKAFGDVHMLSHLVGAANRADIRRLVALEKENSELRERLERQQLRSQEQVEVHDQSVLQLQTELAELQGRLASASTLNQRQRHASAETDRSDASLVALQTQRRAQAEQATANARVELQRLQDEMALLHKHSQTLGSELAAAETQLRELSDPGDGESTPSPLGLHLQGRKILYVGGRPSSTPAIRGLVLRHGGEFQRHGGGAEDRKGLLASAVAGADLVVFPVDCIDHDSAGALKRLCIRQGIPFVPMRKASVASFAAAVTAQAANHG